VKHDNRLQAPISMFARCLLHQVGEIRNPLQVQELLLVRARIAAMLGQARAEAQTTLPLFHDEPDEVSDGDASPPYTDEIPF